MTVEKGHEIDHRVVAKLLKRTSNNYIFNIKLTGFWVEIAFPFKVFRGVMTTNYWLFFNVLLLTISLTFLIKFEKSENEK